MTEQAVVGTPLGQFGGSGGPFVDLVSAQTITGLKTFVPFGTGAIGQEDLIIGDPLDYGLAKIGNSEWGRTSFNAGALDLDGSVLIFNQALPVSSNIEFAFADGTNAIRFALAVPGAGNATYSPRSMIIAGPAALDDEIVTVGYWQALGIFDNLAMDTGANGADLGVQNDLEVEGVIYADNIEESTVDAGLTFTANVAAAAAQGSTLFDGESWRISSPRNGLGDSLNIGWLDTGDATTPNQFAIARSSLSGFMFVMPNAPNPQWIIGSNDNTGAVFIDGNGNKDIFFNRLDTGPDRDNRVIFGDGGIGFDDLSSDILEMRAPAAITPGGYRITLPPDAGNVDEFLRTDGTGVTTWQAIVEGVEALPGSFTETGSTNITTTAATVGLDNEELDPDGNYAIAAGEITVTTGGYFDVSFNIPVNDDSTGGATRGAVQAFVERDQGTGTWVLIPQSQAQDYHREASGGSGLGGSFVAQLADGEAIRLRVVVSSTTDISTEVGESSLSLHRIRPN